MDRWRRRTSHRHAAAGARSVRSVRHQPGLAGNLDGCAAGCQCSGCGIRTHRRDGVVGAAKYFGCGSSSAAVGTRAVCADHDARSRQADHRRTRRSRSSHPDVSCGCGGVDSNGRRGVASRPDSIRRRAMGTVAQISLRACAGDYAI